MKNKTLVLGLVAAGILSAGGYGIYHMGMTHGMSMTAPASNPANGGKVLYYHDPMVPGNKFDKPGKSPFMDMMLVPVYASDDTDQGKITVSPRIQQNLGVRTAAVTEGTLSPQVSAVGSIAFNERDQAFVQARAGAYIERLYVRATLDHVTKGQPLAEVYVPDWIAAQEEFLSVRRMQGTDMAMLIDAARQRMRQVGMNDEQIRRIEASGTTQPHTTLVSPISGVVVELMAREGMTVMPGATLFRINGLSTVWANAEVPESQAALLRPGVKVQAKSPAAPGMTFNGTVQAILPEVNASTRTLKARLELANPGARLVPGMFVQMLFADAHAAKVTLIPTEAVIQTGKRTVVMLAEKEGKFRPVEVDIGIESGGQTEIKRGLQVGQQVVVSSQFLIDSEASLKGVEARLNDQPKPIAVNTAARHQGEAKVSAVARDEITLSHDPIASLKWGAMTMDFKVPETGLPRNVQAGDRVTFEFYMDAEGLPQLTSIAPTANSPATAPTASRPTGSKP
jgi:Cu(I)/Ag(I) efflux system membrane fusion protein